MNEKRLYETTFIVNATLEDQDTEAVVSKVTTYIENHGGLVSATDHWGRKRLAYPINKKFNGYYVHLTFEMMPENLAVIDRFMVLEDSVLRHLTVSLSQEMIDLRTKRVLQSQEAEMAEESEEKEK